MGDIFFSAPANPLQPLQGGNQHENKIGLASIVTFIISSLSGSFWLFVKLFIRALSLSVSPWELLFQQSAITTLGSAGVVFFFGWVFAAFKTNHGCHTGEIAVLMQLDAVFRTIFRRSSASKWARTNERLRDGRARARFYAIPQCKVNFSLPGLADPLTTPTRVDWVEKD